MTQSLSEKLGVRGVSDEIRDTIDRLYGEIVAKQPRNVLRDAYYDGKRAIRKVSAVVPPQYYKLSLVLGWTAKSVDILARRCNLDTFAWPDGELDDLGFREVFDGNDLGAELNQGIVSSLTHSTAFIVTTKGDEGEPPALIHFKDAISATGDWNARARRLDNLLSITGRDEDDRVISLALYLDGKTVTAEREGGKWVAEEQKHAYGMPAERMPYKPRLRRPFGSSRISRPLMGLQDMAVRELIRLEGHMDIYSYPELWMLGADESIFKNADGTQKATFEVMLGRLKGIPDDRDREGDPLARADVKQFPAASPAPHLATLNAIAKMFARESQLPDTALAITDVSNPTSAESYDSSQDDLITEAEGATDDYDPAIRRSMVRALAIANGVAWADVPAEWKTIAPKWRDPRYQSRAAMADAGTKQISAVPWLGETEVGLELLGLTGPQIERALGERKRLAAAARSDVLLAGMKPTEEDMPAESVNANIAG